MSERTTARDGASAARSCCVLCEGSLPRPNAEGGQESEVICPRCWALTTEDRRALRDRAMARVLRRDFSS